MNIREQLDDLTWKLHKRGEHKAADLIRVLFTARAWHTVDCLVRQVGQRDRDEPITCACAWQRTTDALKRTLEAP